MSNTIDTNAFFINARRNALRHLVQLKVCNAKADVAEEGTEIRRAFLDLAHVHEMHWIAFSCNLANVPGGLELKTQMRCEAELTAAAIIEKESE
jgi:hypothetical protein